MKLLDAFYRAGSLVFGGGHVVLPLLQASVVPPGWVSNDAFLAGYGAAQALPGPLFTFAAYLGTVIRVEEGQKVISTGPYALVRHPKYVADIVLVVGIALALGSWALFHNSMAVKQGIIRFAPSITTRISSS